MPTKFADAQWNGTLMDGTGTLKSGSGAVNAPYDWKSRAENGPSTNPEELIAAAHAGCFSMAFAHILAGAGFKATSIKTNAKVTFDKVGDGFAITAIALTTQAQIPGIDEANFKKLSTAAKEGCPVSKALSAVPITLDAKLV